jgi:hypothetical protein
VTATPGILGVVRFPLKAAKTISSTTTKTVTRTTTTTTTNTNQVYLVLGRTAW